MSAKQPTTETIRRIQRDDLAKQVAMRFQQDQDFLIEHSNNPAVKIVREAAQAVMTEQHPPQDVCEWIGVVLFYGEHEQVIAYREAAKADATATYIQARQWLDLIDQVRTHDDTNRSVGD